MKFRVGEMVEVVYGILRGQQAIVMSSVFDHHGHPTYYIRPQHDPRPDIPGDWTAWETALRKLPPDDKQDYLPPETRKLFDGHKVKNPDPQPKTEAA